MELIEVNPLQHITTVDCIENIAKYGILSRATYVGQWREIPSGLGREEILARRQNRNLSNGKPLESHALLFFNARNAMLFDVCQSRNDVVVLRVKRTVLSKEGVRITNVNAASGDKVIDWDVQTGLPLIKSNDVYRKYWNGNEQHKKLLHAEVLVPDAIEPEDISAIHVDRPELRRKLLGPEFPWLAKAKWEVVVDPDLFFKN
jgi:hypothetical protein